MSFFYSGFRLGRLTRHLCSGCRAGRWQNFDQSCEGCSKKATLQHLKNLATQAGLDFPLLCASCTWAFRFGKDLCERCMQKLTRCQRQAEWAAFPGPAPQQTPESLAEAAAAAAQAAAEAELARHERAR